MSVERKRYFDGLKKIQERIDYKKTLIYQTQREIDDLKRELVEAEDSCKHKYDDGSSALKRKGCWVSDVSNEFNSYSGEFEDVDNGYTSYYDECLICGYEIE